MSDKTEKVPYILIFCVAVCLGCAAVVSSAAVGLKDKQVANQILDRQKKVLAVSGLIEEGKAVTPAEVQDKFKKRIKAVVVDLEKGIVDEEATKNAANFDQQKVKKDPAQSKAAPKNNAGVARLPNKALIYMVSAADMGEGGSGFKLSQYIFPVEGKGLWSTLYGFIALAPNGNEIKGLTFYQHAETPGLGGEVDNPVWKAKWPGRMVYGEKGISASGFAEPKISVIKGTAGAASADPHNVDGLSGATITSKGVSNLLKFWLGDKGFGPYIKRVAGQAS